MGGFNLVKLTNSPVVVECEGGLSYEGEYSAETTYDTGDVVSFSNGNSYIAIQETTGNTPTDTTYWQLMAQKGEPGSLTGAGGWETATEYELNEVVSNGDPASSYFALQEHISASNTEPGVGDDWEEYWQLLAQGGSSDAVKCSGEEINEGTDDAKFATPKAIKDSSIAFTTDIPTVPAKATSSEVVEGSDDAKYITPKALKDADITATPPKATFLDINTGTEDAKFVTPLGIAQSDIAFVEDIPVKATGIEVDAGIDDEKFATPLAIAESEEILKASNNLSDLADAEDARDNLGLGTAATKDVGTGDGEIPLLGLDGKIDEAVIPSTLINTVYTVEDNAERDALNPNIGDVAVVEDVNGVSVTYIWDGTAWIELKAATGAVGSVNGKTGTVVLNKDDIGLGNVTNDLQLKAAENLADLPSKATARTNLGLGTSAVKDTGTDEGDIPILSTDGDLELTGDIKTTENLEATKKIIGKSLEVGGGTTPPIKIAETDLLEPEEEGAIEYKDDKLYFTTSGDRKEIPLVSSGKQPIIVSDSFSTTTAGYYYVFGRYYANATRMATSLSARNAFFGSSNAAYGAKAFIVTRESGSVSGGDHTTVVSIVVSGTSITDAGVRTESDSETILEDITQATENGYYETTKRWIGAVTFTLTITGTSPTIATLEYNYGLHTVFDCEGLKMKLKNLSVLLQRVSFSGSDATANIRLLKHSAEGWTYAASGFMPGGTVICEKNTDYETEKTLYFNQFLSYQRRGINTDIDGSLGEGLVLEIRTTLTSAVTNGTARITLEY